MKKIIFLLVSISLLIVLTGCNAQQSKTTSQEDTQYNNIVIEEAEENSKGAQEDDIEIILQKELRPKELEGKWGFVDENNNFIISPKYDDVKAFSEGLAAVEMNELWGFIDREGIMIIEPQYIIVESFENGVAGAADADFNFGFIDTEGNVVIDFVWHDGLGRFGDDFYIVNQNRSWYAVDRNMNAYYYCLANRMLQFRVEGKWYYMDEFGKIYETKDGFDELGKQAHNISLKDAEAVSGVTLEKTPLPVNDHQAYEEYSLEEYLKVLQPVIITDSARPERGSEAMIQAFLIVDNLYSYAFEGYEEGYEVAMGAMLDLYNILWAIDEYEPPRGYGITQSHRNIKMYINNITINLVLTTEYLRDNDKKNLTNMLGRLPTEVLNISREAHNIKFVIENM
ncbi:MAG: WG repeat-containing protein [Clostridiaceae bacterium]|nr:WG repeat-containing protein [Clostridiaceae bacterium]